MDENLDLWADRLGRESMPVFSRTIQSVAGMASNEKSSFAELAWGILQDPTLTAQVLKSSNSVYYNPAAKRINTVSRAVMRLGFDSVRAMCLSASLVETLLSNHHRERVALEVARAFHAAVQAKKLALRRNLPQPEEVFVAALLSRIGQIAFWCFAGELGNKLELALAKGAGQSEARIEMELLGFRLERLTSRLAQEWKLSSLLQSALDGTDAADLRVLSIKLGYFLAQAAEKGWESAESRKVINQIADFLKITEQEALQSVKSAARDAAEIAESFGARQSSCLIPVARAPQEPAIPATEKKIEYPKPDYHIQIGSLRDLSMVVMKKGDFNSVLWILLEGIYRGIGMDRVLFALLTPDRRLLKGKFALGWAEQTSLKDFQVSANGSNNVFTHLMRSLKPIWVGENPPPDIMELLTREISDQIGGGPFFSMPVCIKTQPIGIVCADRSLSGRTLDEESFESFTFFGQQANSSLAALA